MNTFGELLLGIPTRLVFPSGSGSVSLLADERCHVAWNGKGVQEDDITIIAPGFRRVLIELDEFAQLFAWQDIHTVVNFTITYLNCGEVIEQQSFVTFSAMDTEV